MNINALKLLTHLPAFLRDTRALGTDVEKLSADPQLVAEMEASPVLFAAVSEVAEEWQSVQADVTAVQKSNLFTVFPRVARLLSHANILEGTLHQDAKIPELVAAINNSPETKARLVAISAEWRTVEKDVS